MKKRVQPLILLLLLLTLSACSKYEEPDMDEQRRLAFEAWMELYGEGAVKQESGIYMKQLKGSTNPAALTPKNFNWVLINYTARELTNGNVFLTRYADIADHQGSFFNYTNYTPQYIPFVPNSEMYYRATVATPNGFYLALSQMKEGDIYRVFVPEQYGYRQGLSTNSSGFSGQFSLEARLPFVMDIELVKVISDPQQFEAEQVHNFAVFNMNLNLNDTLKKEFYFVSTRSNPTGNVIGKDSSITYYYTGRFLDGFVFDTNEEDTLRKYDRYQYSGLRSNIGQNTHTVGKTSELAKDDLSKILDTAFYHMKYGETARVIMTSRNAFDSTGRFPYAMTTATQGTIVQPFTPVIYDIEIAPKYGDGTLRYPFMVSAIQNNTQDLDGVWVTGYISGVVTGSTIKESKFGKDVKKSEIRSNIILGTYGAKEYKNGFPVLLPDNDLRDRINLVDNYDTHYNRVIRIKGDIRTIFGVRGITNVTDFRMP